MWLSLAIRKAWTLITFDDPDLNLGPSDILSVLSAKDIRFPRCKSVEDQHRFPFWHMPRQAAWGTRARKISSTA